MRIDIFINSEMDRFAPILLELIASLDQHLHLPNWIYVVQSIKPKLKPQSGFHTDSGKSNFIKNPLRNVGGIRN